LRLKLDENLGSRGAELFRQAGHDIVTVPEQRLCSSADSDLLEICRSEKRCLVTLDLDFGNPLLFNHANYAGIAVLRLSPQPTPVDLFEAIQTMIRSLAQKEIAGELWIVQKGKIRIYQPKE